MTRKELTDAFNSLSIEERKQFLQTLSQTEYKKFIKDLGDQAVQDYWDNERELVKQGKGTRNWTVEQQNAILNKDSNGIELKHAGTPKGMDGVAFQGQHMYAVDAYPEYAGDYKNIQALHGSAFVSGTEHNLAYAGNASNQTHGFYDEITVEFSIILNSVDLSS